VRGAYYTGAAFRASRPAAAFQPPGA